MDTEVQRRLDVIAALLTGILGILTGLMYMQYGIRGLVIPTMMFLIAGVVIRGFLRLFV